MFIVITAIVLLFVVIATAKFKIQPFITLILAAILIGLFTGKDMNDILNIVSKGFGNTLSSIGIIIALGTIIGAFLEKSGATQSMASSMLKLFGKKRSPLTVNLIGLLVSIPVFCDSGFVILSSMNKALSKKTGIALSVFAVALSTGLYVSHVFIPPTPGPLAAAAVIGADLGMVLIVGLVVAIPVSLVGLAWARYSGRNEKAVHAESNDTISSDENNPNIFSTLAPILLPIVLIALRSVAKYPTMPFGDGQLLNVLDFIGHPISALFIGVFTANLLVIKSNKEEKLIWVTDALKNAGLIILVTGAGGAFGAILRESNIEEIVGGSMVNANMGIFLPFIIAAILKTAQGSSTVAIITTAAIIAPLTSQLGIESDMAKALVVAAIGAGAMTVSHINDSFFWVVAQFSDMDMKTALKTHTPATLLQGFASIIIIFILYNLFA